MKKKNYSGELAKTFFEIKKKSSFHFYVPRGTFPPLFSVSLQMLISGLDVCSSFSGRQLKAFWYAGFQRKSNHPTTRVFKSFIFTVLELLNPFYLFFNEKHTLQIVSGVCERISKEGAAVPNLWCWCCLLSLLLFAFLVCDFRGFSWEERQKRRE